MSIAVGLAGSTLAIWVYLILARGGYWRLQDGVARRQTLAVWPGITCIIPARDEAEHVGETLRSLSAQQYAGPLKILLVDDQSTDATAAIAETFDAVTVLRGSSLPPQWTGKLWALQQGLDHTANKWPASAFVLFTDADICWHDPHALSELTAEALAQDLVLNSRMVTLRCESAAERALVPAFVYFFPQLYPFRWINDPSHAMAGAAGGCMLLRRDALDRAPSVSPWARASRACGPILLLRIYAPWSCAAPMRSSATRASCSQPASAASRSHISRHLCLRCLHTVPRAGWQPPPGC